MITGSDSVTDTQVLVFIMALFYIPDIPFILELFKKVLSKHLPIYYKY